MNSAQPELCFPPMFLERLEGKCHEIIENKFRERFLKIITSKNPTMTLPENRALAIRHLLDDPSPAHDHMSAEYPGATPSAQEIAHIIRTRICGDILRNFPPRHQAYWAPDAQGWQSYFESRPWGAPYAAMMREYRERFQGYIDRPGEPHGSEDMKKLWLRYPQEAHFYRSMSRKKPDAPRE